MKELNQLMQAQFDKMCERGKLFRSSITGQQAWDLYLESFSPIDDPIFRDPKSSVHNCNLCNNFIRRYGNVVAIDYDYSIMTIWDIYEAPKEYLQPCKILSNTIASAPIKDVFFETFAELNSLPYEKTNTIQSRYQLGVAKNVKRYTKEEADLFGVVKPNEIREFNHLHLFLPNQFVQNNGKSIESIIGDYRDDKNVFQTGMEVISLDTLKLVRDLINQGSLLDGATHLGKVERMIIVKAKYDTLSPNVRDNWCWDSSYKYQYARFKNELIGVLCSELSEGMELNKACQNWNKRVDPVNYMKVTAPITKKQIEEAEKFVIANNYVDSFSRRFANIDDIKASEILHVNMGDGKLKEVSMFDNVKATSTRHKRTEFDKIEEVSIEKFMSDILPNCTSVEAFLTSKQEGNLVTLTTSNVPNSKPIFKWDNNYSWTFKGNLAGKSQIKEAVKSAGGEVNGLLRFSISWNEDGLSHVDFDAHAKQPNGTEIYYSNYKGYRNNASGMLDVDMIRPPKQGVENINWVDKSKMPNGKYIFFNRNFDGGSNTGFKAEVEFDGQIYKYQQIGKVFNDTKVATVTLKDGEFTIEHHLPLMEEEYITKEIYGIETNKFHKVNLVCLSPNHWGNNNVGNKHYLFMLDGCKCMEPIRSFHNENLLPELAAHRRVLEVLAANSMINPLDKQLSGLGFNATVRDELVVRLKGSFQRVIKIKF